MHLFVTSWLLLASTVSHPAASSPDPARCPADYAVYSVVLDSLYRNVAVEAFLVGDSTRGSFPFSDRNVMEAALVQESEISAALLEDYARRNESTRALEDCFDTTRRPVQLVGRAERERIGAAASNWDGYPDGYPAHGMVTFSRVGFTQDRAQAILQVFFHCGGRCGGGQVVLLNRRNGAWVVRKAITTYNL